VLLGCLGNRDAIMLDAIDNLLLHFRSNAVVLLHTSCLLAAAKYTRLVYEERGEVHELITTKTDLQRRKSDFGRKGNNWIEPLREWILAAHYAEKLASYSAEGGKEKIGYKFHL